jgi:hypothetical protein
VVKALAHVTKTAIIQQDVDLAGWIPGLERGAGVLQVPLPYLGAIVCSIDLGMSSSFLLTTTDLFVFL